MFGFQRRREPSSPLYLVNEVGGDIDFTPGQHLYIAGQTGSGKSTLINHLIRNLADGAVRQGQAEIFGVDLKDGLELSQWRDVMTRLATNMDETIELLADLDAERRRRNHLLLEQGLTKVAPGRDTPLVFLFLDEAASLGDGVGREERKRQEEARTLLGRILRLGRSAGITVVAATQDPRLASFDLRDRFPNRVCLAVASKAEATLTLGEDAVRDGCMPHAIPPTRPGTGYWYDREHHQPVRFRVAEQ